FASHSIVSCGGDPQTAGDDDDQWTTGSSMGPGNGPGSGIDPGGSGSGGFGDPGSGLGGEGVGGVPDCEGNYLIGKRCVQKEHVTHVEKEAQQTDEGKLVYDFERTYQNNGTLKKNSPKIPPSADLGKWMMYNGDFVRIGVSVASFVATADKVNP